VFVYELVCVNVLVRVCVVCMVPVRGVCLCVCVCVCVCLCVLFCTVQYVR